MTKLFESIMNIILEQKLSTVNQKLTELGVNEETKKKIFEIDPTVPSDWETRNWDKIVANYSLWIWRIGTKFLKQQNILYTDEMFRLLIKNQFEIPLQWHAHLSEKKALTPEERNINNFKSIEELERTLERFPQYTRKALPKTIKSLDEKAKLNGGDFDQFETNKWYIRIPHNFKQAYVLGEREEEIEKNSPWCTQNEEHYFDTYYKKDYLWILIEKKEGGLIGDKWILHFENNEFLDQLGEPLRRSQKGIRSVEQLFKEDPELPRIIYNYVKENEPENIGYYYRYIYLYIPELNDPDKLDKDLIKNVLTSSPFSLLTELSYDQIMDQEVAEEIQDQEHINVKIINGLSDEELAEIVTEMPDIYETIQLTYEIAFSEEPAYEVQIQQVKADPEGNIKFIRYPSDEMIELQAEENSDFIYTLLDRDILPSEDMIFKQIDDIGMEGESGTNRIKDLLDQVLTVMEHNNIDEISYDLMEIIVCVEFRYIFRLINIGIYPPEKIQLLQIIKYMDERVGSLRDYDFAKELDQKIKEKFGDSKKYKSVLDDIKLSWGEEDLHRYAVQKYPEIIQSIIKQGVNPSQNIHRLQAERLGNRNIKPTYDYMVSHYEEIFNEPFPDDIKDIYNEEISASNVQKLFGEQRCEK